MTTTGPTGAATGEPTPLQLAERAAEAIRTLSHLTCPDVGAPPGPAETSDLVAALATTAARLPQLIGQLASRLVAEQEAGRLRVDAMSASPDPATAVAATTTALSRAATYAARAARDLDTAHQDLAHLAITLPYSARIAPATGIRPATPPPDLVHPPGNPLPRPRVRR